MMQQTACGQQSLQRTKAGRLKNEYRFRKLDLQTDLPGRGIF